MEFHEHGRCPGHGEKRRVREMKHVGSRLALRMVEQYEWLVCGKICGVIHVLIASRPEGGHGREFRCGNAESVLGFKNNRRSTARRRWRCNLRPWRRVRVTSLRTQLEHEGRS